MPDASSTTPEFIAHPVHDGVVTLAVAGEVDIAVADELVAAAYRCLREDGVRTLVVDLAAVTFLDSSGLGGLVRVRNFAQSQDQHLEIANVAESVMKVFTITGLAGALTFVSTGEGAEPTGSADD